MYPLKITPWAIHSAAAKIAGRSTGMHRTNRSVLGRSTEPLAVKGIFDHLHSATVTAPTAKIAKLTFTVMPMTASKMPIPRIISGSLFRRIVNCNYTPKGRVCYKATAQKWGLKTD